MFLICFWLVIDAWQKFNIVQIAIGSTSRPLIWGQITWGTLELSFFSQNITSRSLSNIEIPWELFQSGIFVVYLVSML
jgi:hypothetical protein